MSTPLMILVGVYVVFVLTLTVVAAVRCLSLLFSLLRYKSKS